MKSTLVRQLLDEIEKKKKKNTMKIGKEKPRRRDEWVDKTRLDRICLFFM